MLHHPTKNATTAAGLRAEVDRRRRSPFAALIVAAVLALLTLALVPAAALAQTETTAPDPAAPAPPEPGAAGEPEPEGDEDTVQMPGILVTEDCKKVGPIKIGDCGSGDKDPPAEPPAADPSAEPPAPDQYGSTSPEAGQYQYPEEPAPDAAENPLNDPMREQCDVLYPVGGTTGGTTSPEEEAALEEETMPQEEAAPEAKTTLEETALPEEGATPPGGTTSGASDEPTEEECRQMRESNEATPQEAEPTPTATEPDPAVPEATDPAGHPEVPQEDEPAPGTPAPEDGQPEAADPTLTPAAEPEAAPETTDLPEGKTTPEDPATGERAPEAAPEEPAPQPKAVAPAEDVCPGVAPVEISTGGPGNQYSAAFEITGESFVLSYHATPADPADEEGTLVMDIVETEGGTTVETVRAKSEEPEQTPIEVGPGTYTVNVYSDNRNYEVTAYDCAGLAASAEEPVPGGETPEETTAPAPDENLGIPEAAPEATPAAAPEDATEPQPGAGFELPAAPQGEPAPEPEGEPAPPEAAPVADEETAELQPTSLRIPQSTATAQPASLPTRQTQKGVVAVLPETGGEPAPGPGFIPKAAMAGFSIAAFGVLGLLLLQHRYPASERTDEGGAAPSEGQSG